MEFSSMTAMRQLSIHSNYRRSFDLLVKAGRGFVLEPTEDSPVFYNPKEHRIITLYNVEHINAYYINLGGLRMHWEDILGISEFIISEPVDLYLEKREFSEHTFKPRWLGVGFQSPYENQKCWFSCRPHPHKTDYWLWIYVHRNELYLEVQTAWRSLDYTQTVSGDFTTIASLEVGMQELLEYI